jgi:putative Mn2+ efflux pump MntP
MALTAISLAMDCTAVAIAYGISVRQGRPTTLLKLAIAFGGFQALLFVIGWGLGSGLHNYIGPWDHWIAFILLSGIGAKMIQESFAGGEKELRPLEWARLLLLALATSIDAMAAGLGLALVESPVLVPAGLVGGFSSLLPAIGFHAASKLGTRLGRWAERWGGVVLVIIGLRLLIQHTRQGI